jgi:hypothetical protein
MICAHHPPLFHVLYTIDLCRNLTSYLGLLVIKHNPSWLVRSDKMKFHIERLCSSTNLIKKLNELRCKRTHVQVLINKKTLTLTIRSY